VLGVVKILVLGIVYRVYQPGYGKRIYCKVVSYRRHYPSDVKYVLRISYTYESNPRASNPIISEHGLQLKVNLGRVDEEKAKLLVQAYRVLEDTEKAWRIPRSILSLGDIGEVVYDIKQLLEKRASIEKLLDKKRSEDLIAQLISTENNIWSKLSILEEHLGLTTDAIKTLNTFKNIYCLLTGVEDEEEQIPVEATLSQIRREDYTRVNLKAVFYPIEEDVN